MSNILIVLWQEKPSFFFFSNISLVVVCAQLYIPSLISYANTEWELTARREGKPSIYIQVSVIDFSWIQSTDKNSKGGPSGKALKNVPSKLLQYFPVAFCGHSHISWIVSDSQAPSIHISHRVCLIYFICFSPSFSLFLSLFLLSGI